MNIIEINNLTKIYKDKTEIKALDNISFSVGKSEIIGLLGPNGAGKTTAIKCMCSLLIPNSGTVIINGADAVKKPKKSLENISAVLEGNRNIYWRMTVKENLEFFTGLQGIPKDKEHINNLVNFFNLRDKLNTQARFLSRGMQQKLAVGCAFVRNTPVLLLDEPTLGMDVEMTHEMRHLIKKKALEEQKTILVSSHNMKLIEDVCEKVIIIAHGHIVAMDEISKIKTLFSIKSYLFEIDGNIEDNTKKELTGKINASKITENEDSTTIHIEMKKVNELYNIMEFFRAKDFNILKFETQEPDLEEIYLKILKNEKIH